MKSNQLTYNFVSDPQNFDTIKNLITSYNEVKERLFSEFWSLVAAEIKKDKRINNWKVGYENFDINDFEGIWLYDSNDKEQKFSYWIVVDPKMQVWYGLVVDSDSMVQEKVIEIYEEAKKFKETNWKTNSFKSGGPPLWFNIDGWNFQDDVTIKNILPANRNIAIKEIVDAYLDDFTQDIQNFILKHLRLNKIIN